MPFLSRANSIYELDSERWASKYRCCCGCCHLKKASALSGVFDLCLFAGIFGRGVQLYMNIKSSPASVSWLTAATLLFFLGVGTILCLWYGIWRENSLWILPRIVLKIFTIIAIIIFTFVLMYLVYSNSTAVVIMVADELDFDYFQARRLGRIGGSILILVVLAMGVMQFWFLVVIYDCYRYVRKRELDRITATMFPSPAKKDNPPRRQRVPPVPEVCVTTPTGVHTKKIERARPADAKELPNRFSERIDLTTDKSETPMTKVKRELSGTESTFKGTPPSVKTSPKTGTGENTNPISRTPPSAFGHETVHNKPIQESQRISSVPVRTPEIRTSNGTIPMKVVRPRSVIVDTRRELDSGLECTCSVPLSHSSNHVASTELLMLTTAGKEPLATPPTRGKPLLNRFSAYEELKNSGNLCNSIV